ncbi:MAG TPA: GvpL/GvpF family gas vesicle protein [Enteractinococcus sp.]
MTPTGLYVYALVPADTLTQADLPRGIDGAALDLVPAGQLAAIVHECETEPYQGPDSDVKRWVLEHSQVVDDAWQAAGTVLPMTFNVIVAPATETEQTAQHRLGEWLTSSADTIRDHLEKLRNHVELRVDISLDEETVTASHPEVLELSKGLEDRPAGVQRLYRKRLEERTRQVAERIADQLYPQYRQRLVALAEDMVENSKPGRTPGMVTVLTASLLVHQDNVDAVGVALADIRDNQPGVQIRYLGPWPPYSFADVPALEN